MVDEQPRNDADPDDHHEDAPAGEAPARPHPRRIARPHPPINPSAPTGTPPVQGNAPRPTEPDRAPQPDLAPRGTPEPPAPAPSVNAGPLPPPAAPPTAAPRPAGTATMAAPPVSRTGRPTSVIRVARSVDVNMEQEALARRRQSQNRITGWLYQKEEVAHHERRPWYQVLCLTGVDYFSTLGYQPGIALLAAGLLSPLATLILVLFTLVAALPVYSRVAKESPRGQGSIAMLERLLPRWRGKLFVLVLLGFAATSWIITITLSAADATAHIVENPVFPNALRHNVVIDVGITLVLIGFLGGVFLKGFREAIGLAVLLVIIYLGLNAVVIARSLAEVGADPDLIANWRNALRLEHGNVLGMIGVALLLFPRLALGLSGFETGVAVMPLVQGDGTDTDQHPAGRIRNTRKLLATAALIMSVYLITSSIATTLLVPEEAYREGGEANGRALAFLAHMYLGSIFGTAYDLSTIGILWFAGASALAGLLNLTPQYLPSYGMAPRWAAAQRPLVLVFTLIAFVVTILFRADVNAQGAAYATGVLVLMLSASIAVVISFARSRSAWVWVFLPIALGFVYITLQNIRGRPSGLIIAILFIVAIVVTSVISRVLRSTELRVSRVFIDRAADRMIRGAVRDGRIRLITHDPKRGTSLEAYEREVREAQFRHGIPPDEPFLLVEVMPGDPSVFQNELIVSSRTVGPYGMLRCEGAAIANSIAALAVVIHGQYACRVHLQMRWTPIDSVLDALGEGIEFLLWGGGDMARLVEIEVRHENLSDEIIVHAA